LGESECDDDEYRCRNGQCIPSSFWHDNIMNPDCLDKSDETINLNSPRHCIMDPSFRCEETTCAHGSDTICGDGQCLSDLWFWSSLGTCNNLRDYLIYQTILSYRENVNISFQCWSSMVCLLKFPLHSIDLNCNSVCGHLNNRCIEFVRDHCPTRFLFPSYPILFGQSC
jgi:hypothetical protein